MVYRVKSKGRISVRTDNVLLTLWALPIRANPQARKNRKLNKALDKIIADNSDLTDMELLSEGFQRLGVILEHTEQLAEEHVRKIKEKSYKSKRGLELGAKYITDNIRTLNGLSKTLAWLKESQTENEVLYH